MDIQKKKRKSPRPKQEEPDLSFLKEEQPGEINEIQQPQHLTYKLGSVLKQRSLIEAIAAIILFGSGLGIGMYFSGSQQAAETAPDNQVASRQIPASQIAGIQDQVFPPDVFHRIELISGDIYYSLITSTENDFYHLSQVFYTVKEEETEDGPPRLVLAMYEQNDDQPAGDLLLPSEQVKAVSQLADSSSVVEAIEQYLANPLEAPVDGSEADGDGAEE